MKLHSSIPKHVGRLYLLLAFGVLALPWTNVQAQVAANANSTQAPTKTTVYRTGPVDQRLDIVVIGDGFRAGADQTTFNNYVTQQVVTNLFNTGILSETKGAFNIHRINTFSRSSGVTQVSKTGGTGGNPVVTTVTTSRQTALDWRVNGQNRFCWNERGPNQNSFQSAIINGLAPEADFVVVVLNEPTGGGCARGSMSTLHLPSGAATIRHELGHAIGNLCDEYIANTPQAYTGGEPGCTNLTTNINRASLKWRNYVPSSRSLPTTFSGTTMNAAESAGAFVGGSIGAGNNFNAGIWRSSFNNTMRGNGNRFGPVNYEQMRLRIDEWLDYSFDDTVVGDFNGDGRDDLVIQDDVSMWLHLSQGNTVGTDFSAAERIPGSWQFKDGDMLRSTGTEFEVARRYDDNLPGWEMSQGDQFYVGDIDGDGRDDMYVFNGENWSIAYLGLIGSNGNSLSMIRRYDENAPGWQMREGDRHVVGDFNGDGRDELSVFNGSDWKFAYLGLFQSHGEGLFMARRYDDNAPGWEMRRDDRHYVADFNNDEKDDLYLFNGQNWNQPYLGMLRSEGSGLAMSRRYDQNIPGWQMRPDDIFHVADVDGDQRHDLYVYNHRNWDTQYLGVLRSQGAALAGSWQDDRVNGWNLGSLDRFLVGNFNGGGGWDDLYVRNASWLGMLRSQGASVQLRGFYKDWIHDVESHRFGWW